MPSSTLANLIVIALQLTLIRMIVFFVYFRSLEHQNLCINLQKGSSFWETSAPRPPTGASPLDPTGGLLSPRSPANVAPGLLHSLPRPQDARINPAVVPLLDISSNDLFVMSDSDVTFAISVFYYLCLMKLQSNPCLSNFFEQFCHATVFYVC